MAQFYPMSGRIDTVTSDSATLPASLAVAFDQPWSVLPTAFLERLPEVVPAAQLTAVLQSFTKPRPTTFRVNRLKTTAAELQAELTADGFEVEPVSWYTEAFILRSRSLRELTEHPAYLAGRLYVQSLSSMIPPLVLAPQPSESVLDIAAAPGSKTTQMAMMMGNTGQIVANDTSLVRLYKLQANLKMQGVDNVVTRRGLGQALWTDFPGVFDRALVDVPCSMEGRFNTAKPKTWSNWSPKKVKELSLRQRSLLRSAVSATQPGGVIVYSTCTLSPEENEGVIEWILKKEPTLSVEPIQIAGLVTQPPLKHWKKQVFSPGVANSVRILPTELMEGFFVACLRKAS